MSTVEKNKGKLFFNGPMILLFKRMQHKNWSYFYDLIALMQQWNYKNI